MSAQPSANLPFPPTPGVQPLTQGERLINTFSAPSRTFADILRDQSWWLPFLLGLLVGYGYTFAIQKQVGWDTAANTVLRQDPKASQRLANSTPESRAQTLKITESIIQYSFYASPLLALLISAIASLVLWGTINLLFGGHATFGRVFAVWMYGTLPLLFKSMLAMIALFAGLDKDAFNINNPVGTNPGYFLPVESAQWLLRLTGAMDVLWIWALMLVGIGLAVVARVKRTSGLMAVFAWFFLILLVRVVWAAISA